VDIHGQNTMYSP